MIAVLSKPADQVDVNDLQELIDSGVPESDQITPVSQPVFGVAANTNRSLCPGRWPP